MSIQIDKDELNELLWKVLRGRNQGYTTLEVIQEATEYSESIPKRFWKDEEKGYYGILGLKNASIEEMIELKNTVIEAIIREIKSPDVEKHCDNYFRLFHGLSILKVSKDDQRVPAPTNSPHIYNAAYWLWQAENESNYGFLSAAAWNVAEAFKTN